MFFPEKIVSIKSTDRVLEVGPGGTPYPRANVLLEKEFDEDEAREQRGRTQKLETDKTVVYYSGGKFPFDDNEFDYVICSHVLEHVPEEEVDEFIGELQRVARKGYLEFPTVYYEYLYNFKVHTTLLNYKDNVVYYMKKEDSGIDKFFPLQRFFYRTLECGYDELVVENKMYFFQGFEWFNGVRMVKTDNVSDLVAGSIDLKPKTAKKSGVSLRSIIRKLFKR